MCRVTVSKSAVQCGWGLRSAAHDAASPITQCRRGVMCQTNKDRRMHEGEARIKASAEHRVWFLNESAWYSRDPEFISHFSVLSVCLSVLWFILRVLSNSHYRPTPSRFCVSLLTIAAELFMIFLQSVRVNEWVVHSETTTVYFQTYTYW